MSNISPVVTGLGPVSAIGCGRREFWQSLIAGKHGFAPITLCDVSRSPSKIGAEVKDFRLERYVEKARAIAGRLPRAIQFALAAGALAFEDAQIDLAICDRGRIGVTVGVSLGNLGELLTCRDAWLEGRAPTARNAFQFFHHSAACVLSSFFDLRGPLHTVSTGCNSGLDALGQAARQIQLGLVDAMLVVGTDCELVPEILAALNASKSLTTRYNEAPESASRPFDRDRDGNVIGEGAAALLLESDAHACARKANRYARFSGYAMCASGKRRRYSHNQPEFDLQPCIRALQGAMNEAGWRAQDVDVVSANGSSSVLYDRFEALALAETFGRRFPDLRVHSTKSMLGQHGAGSSALQAVAACLALSEGVIPPTINCENKDPACGEIRVVAKAESFRPRAILTHAIGFGGFYYSCAAFAAPN